MIGTTISHYKILKKLGQGGMGIVYQAQDTKLDRLVALKFLPDHLTANEAEQARFLQEAKAASSLNHPNVCTIYGIGEHEGHQFIEMEFVEGETLRQRIPIANMSELLSYATQIADALQEAHAKSIVHRDIKADNIMINAKQQAKVMDFGLAKLKGSLKLTRTSSTVGTLAYMAPEQLQSGDVDHRSDIFSFAVVLFEMLTGKLPFRGDHEAAIMYSILNEEPESAEKYKPDISPEFVHILHRGLEKDPADRYQSVQEMLIDLRRLQKQSSKVTRRLSAEIPVSRETSRVVMSGEPETGLAPTQNSRRLIVASALLGALVILGGLWFFRSTGSSRNTQPFSAINITRLTTSGQATIAAISPDGKYVAHVVRNGELRSLRVRQVATKSDVEIVSAANIEFRSVAFSADGNFIRYVGRSDEFSNGMLFEIPVLGGVPKRLVGDVSSAVTYSPDRKKIAFVRQYHNAGEESLLLTNADGTGERKVATRKGDDFFISGIGVGPAWSPDGKVIAASVGSNVGIQHINLFAYSPDDGKQSVISNENWRNIGRLSWTPDGKGLVFVGTRKNSAKTQLFYISYPEGVVRSVTNDLSSYDERSLAVTTDGSTLVTTNYERRSNLWTLRKSGDAKDPWNAQNLTQITTGLSTDDGRDGLSWVENRSLIYTATSNRYVELWMIDKEGTNRKELPFDEGGSFEPGVSTDGKHVAFVSDRDSTAHIFYAELDGESARRVTSSEDYNPTFSNDNKWIFYAGWATGKILLYKVPPGGGDTVNLSQSPANYPNLSPDGKRIVCVYYDTTQKKWSNAILTTDGTVLRVFRLPYSADIESVRWNRDGTAISYIDTRNAISNIWSIPVEGGDAVQLTTFTSGLIFRYAWSCDGEYLAVARGEETSDVVLITEKSEGENNE